MIDLILYSELCWKDAVKELGSLLQAKSLALQELTRKVEVLRDTLDCTYTGKTHTFSTSFLLLKGFPFLALFTFTAMYNRQCVVYHA